MTTIFSSRNSKHCAHCLVEPSRPQRMCVLSSLCALEQAEEQKFGKEKEDRERRAGLSGSGWG